MSLRVFLVRSRFQMKWRKATIAANMEAFEHLELQWGFYQREYLDIKAVKLKGFLIDWHTLKTISSLQ